MRVLDPERLARVLRAAAGAPLAVVTGAAGGIGVGIVQALVEDGYAVVATDIGGDRLEKTFPDAERVALAEQDVSSEQSWTERAAEIEAGAGRLDVLVNNAGVLHVNQPMELLAPDEFRRVVEINLVGTFLGIRACTPLLRRSDRASIVNFSSGEAYHATPGFSAYTSSKWAVRGLTKSAAVELAGDGIRCNSVHPWGIDSGMLRGADGTESVDRLLAGIPLGRVGVPQEVGTLVAFLAGPASAFSTGAEFVVDGGAIASSGF